ncbi:MAG: adenylate kinase family enzyme [Rhodothermales bacterium]|jgi:adenylate kinase family enzyme
MLDIPHIELDGINHMENWQQRPSAEFHAMVDARTESGRWIVDGNYSGLPAMLWPKATHLIWLSYSFPLVLGRGLKRTIRRVVTKEELFSGNVETFRQAFMSGDSVLHYMVVNFHRKRKAYRRTFKDDGTWGLEIVELTSPRETEAFLRRLEETAQPRPT